MNHKPSPPNALPSRYSPPAPIFRGVAAGLRRLFLLLAMTASAIAQHHADTVVMFRPGTGPGIGRQPAYFPNNVLGFPDTSARPTVPSVNPAQILSLGLGGEIVLGFRTPIVDRAGADFTVFENAFHYNLGGKQRTFAEPATVAVSSDGVSFVEFPFDSATLVGCAGITPTDGRANPLDPAQSGGDHFDLSDVGMDSVRFIRLRDATAIVINNPNHPFWDPTLTSFDLDAVVAIHAATPNDTNITGTPQPALALRFGTGGEARVTFGIRQEAHVRVAIWNRLGQQVRQLADRRLSAGEHSISLATDSLPLGVWFLSLEEEGRIAATLPFAVAR